MRDERLLERLSRRAPGEWELYVKTAESRELASTAESRSERLRREQGWAARFWEGGAPRFASACGEAELERALSRAARTPTAPAEPPEWPGGRTAGQDTPALKPPEPPPELFEEVSRRVSAESRGEASLTELTVRRGASLERIRNARGLDVSIVTERLDGFACAAGRRGARACEARAVFRWEDGPEAEALARRLADRATLPLADRRAPFPIGEWLLDPSVASALLAAAAPLFTGFPLPAWVARERLFSPRVTIVDDAAADAPWDGEGTPTRRVVVVEDGVFRTPLRDLRSARRSGEEPTGHGVRPSYRTPPAPLPRRLFFEGGRESPRELLSSVRRGLFASALTAPASLDLEADRYDVEFTGVEVLAGRAQGPVGGARASGRLSELFRRISAVSTDRQFFPTPHMTGAPTLLIERAAFE